MEKFINDDWIDCTESDLQNGDLYRIDLGGGGYSQKRYSDVALEAEKIRTITKRSFLKRLTQSERIAIRKSTDDVVIDIHEDLLIASHVDLNDDDVKNAVDYLLGLDLISAESKVKLLADGTEQERF